MPVPVVTFQYFTGVECDFTGADLLGAWDPQGEASAQYSSHPMQAGTGPDGCPCFEAQVQFPATAEGHGFHWGVRLNREGAHVWGIAEELNDRNSRENVCWFRVEAGPGQIEWYRLNWSRHLGAQKVLANGRERVQFAVWAPQAQKVEVVMGELREKGAPASAIDPTRTPALAPIRADAVSGGYISEQEGAFDGWGPFPMLAKDGYGIWRTDLQAADFADFAKFNHCPYMYRVTREDHSVAFRTDLYSRCQIGFGSIRPEKNPEGWKQSQLTRDLDGLVSCSVVKDPDFVCREFGEDVYPEQYWLKGADFWNVPAHPNTRPVPSRVQDLVIYELHIGALGYGKDKEKPGTLEDACDFLDHLQELGINAIELLPLAEFGGGGAGWGYATSHYFAIEYAGGGRDKYKHFIRECHRRGMAVILDVVFNHYHHEAERAEWMYDGNAHERNLYYWYEGLPGDYPQFDAAVKPEQAGQGGYVDNVSTGWAPRYYDPMVRRMFVSSLLALATEFKVDGFRFDQTTSIHAYNSLHADGRPVTNANLFGQKLLREATRALRIVKPEIMLMAEDHSNWDAVTQPNDQGGLGFDAAWYADFYHHLIGDTDKGSDYAKILKTAGLGGDEPLALDYFAGALGASGSRHVVFHESHDEAGNGQCTDRTINVAVNGASLTGQTRNSAEARVRTVAGITILSAGVPMFLFGEEVGARNKFLYGQVLANREDYRGLRQAEGKLLFCYYAALIRLRLDPDRPAFRSQEIEVVHVHNANRIIAFRRWDGHRNFLVIASLNNRPFNSPSYSITSTRLGDERWQEIFNSDAQMFGGQGVGNYGGVRGFAGGIDCVLPANGLLVFQRI